MANHRRTLGKLGEDLACQSVMQQGWEVLARNWRSHRVEIDIVARDANAIVFCEVKTRRTNACGVPAEAVTQIKRRHMRQAALYWLAAHQGVRGPIRFDVIGVSFDASSQPRITHIKGIDV